jgi:hypothetical protein
MTDRERQRARDGAGKAGRRRVVKPTGGAPTHPLLALQRSAGNRATAALVDSIQRKAATAGRVDDPLEREADAMADAVLAGRSTPTASRASTIQRWPWSKKKDKSKDKPLEISGPTNARKMTLAEQGGALSAKQILEMYERQKADEQVEGVSEMFQAAELEAEREPKRQMALKGGEGNLSDESVEGVDRLFFQLPDVLYQMLDDTSTKLTIALLKDPCEKATSAEREEAYADKTLMARLEKALPVRDYIKLLGYLRVNEAPTTGKLAEGGGAKGGHTKAETADELIQDKMQAYVADAVKAGKKVAGQVAILSDADFRKAYLDEYGPKDTEVDETNAFVRTRGKDGLIVIHQDRGNAGTTIHEGMHKYSDATLQSHVGFDFNEGVTEFFTREITLNLKPPIKRGNYQQQYLFADALAKKVSKDVLAKAYFNGQYDALVAAFAKATGRKPEEWADVIANMRKKDWRAAYELVTKAP